MYKLGKCFIRIHFFALLLIQASVSIAQSSSIKYPGIGRIATPAEVSAWDIDVRPDFKGLPKGSGSVEKGQDIWEAKCANCHGTFGESNEVFTPIAGGTTLADLKTGRVAALNDTKQPQRTTLMKVATVSTLWDYVYRAMPWNAPRSLSPDETYALVAFMLSLGEIVPDNFVLSDQNIAQVKMPNRNGMTTQHGMWSFTGKADVNAKACMTNCVPFVQIGSTLPDFARNAHENIAEQNRPYGPYRGADTTKPPIKALPADSGIRLTQVVSAPILTKSPADLFKSQNCSACHAPNTKLVGPSITEVANKYRGTDGAQTQLMVKIKIGGAGVWGLIPMPAQGQLSNDESQILIAWMLSGGKK